MQQLFTSHFTIKNKRSGKLALAIGAIAAVTVPVGLPVRAQSDAPVPIESSEQPNVLTGTRFSCQLQSGQYTVVYQPKSQPGKVFPWATPSAMGGGWASDRRCYEISRRLESYRPDGLLEMRTGIENGYNIICATTEKNPVCRIILTVPVGQDPVTTRDRVFSNLTVADSGQTTAPVATFVEGERNNILGIDLGGLLGGRPQRNTNNNTPARTPSRSSFSGDGIYLKPFLDPSDGGTGTGLQNGVPIGRQFRPGRFR
ncbi:COP23 domain-containing protein [Pseudanabaena sp. PCC 6802]|uniref:COP23 domain-containing protein n=1 Tax=Pseudanabaena sp. PCC 6802 TaxID=118173 RepID=UPI000347A9D8|nr:COP23 domain-containing protein [Pseudanabaena sp. PCC 6802]